jgi:uncharacterized protein
MAHPTRLLLPLFGLFVAARAATPVLLDTTTVYRQNFDGLAITGKASFASLPDGWRVVESGSNADDSLVADAGTSNAGNTYSYGLAGSTDRALGTLASGSLTSRIEFRIVNGTGQAVDSVSVRFRAEQWRFGSGTTDSMAAAVAVNRSLPTPAPALTIREDQGNANGANPDANTNAQTLSGIVAVALGAGDTLVLSWSDGNAAGNDDGWAIDDFELRIAHLGEANPPPPPPPAALRGIHEIQGRGAASPLRDSIVSFTGIVTGSFVGSAKLGGFFAQSPDDAKDSDPLTSEGIFVDLGSSASPIAVGDSVLVRGKVAESYGLTKIVEAVATVLASGKALPAAAPLVLPLDSLGAPERWEGMRVRVPQSLVVTGNYTLGRYGEMVLAPRRQMAPTQVASPGAAAQAALRADSLARLVVDDGSSVQNPATVPYPTGGLSATNTLRTGDRVDSLEGVLDFAFGAWTLRPTRAPVFEPANPRPIAPPRASEHLRVASFNVLNYFTTLGTAAACGPRRTLECRGASDTSEFRRQKAKIVSALLELDADIVGLMEIENHPGDSALEDLVQALCDATGPGTWKRAATGPVGTDAIKVALIHKTARVEATDSVAILTSLVDPNFADTQNRPALARTFRDNWSGRSFTVVVNHLKSKGSACANDPDLGDGQGNCNQVRTRAARALARWTKTRPTGTTSPEVLLLGDFNAYAKEDPVRALVDSGFVNLALRDEGDSSYTYQFGSAFGSLDHAFATAELASKARAAHWAINADEPVVLGYNREYKSASQIESYFRPDPYASSDHDPVVVDLDFCGTSSVVRPGASKTWSRATRNGLTLDASFLAAGAAWELVSPAGERFASGILDADGRASLRQNLSGAFLLRIRAAGTPSVARLLVVP